MFRMGLGPLFGGRLLLLVHTGRVSGLPRRTAIEVVEAGTHEGRACWTVASGFGPGADWFRNLRQTPHATVQVGRRYHAVTAQVLTAEEGGELMARYAPATPGSPAGSPRTWGSRWTAARRTTGGWASRSRSSGSPRARSARRTPSAKR